MAGSGHCGLGLAARWSGKARGTGGAGCTCGWLPVGLGGKSGWSVGERRRRLAEKEGGVLERDAWAAGGEAGEKADGSAVGAMVGGMGLGRAGQCWRSRFGGPGL